MSQVIYDLPAAEYHARPEVSKSQLDLLARSPAHFKGSARDETKAMTFGSAWHCYALEHFQFAKRYAVEPDFGDCRKTANREAKGAWRIENTDRTLIAAEDMERIKRMTDAIYAHDAASYYLAITKHSEVSVISENEGVAVRSRLDGLTLAPNHILDLKSTENASAEAFAKSVLSYRYHVQAAFYIDNARLAGLPVDSMVFIAVEKESPYAVAVYELDTASIELGRRTYQKLLAQYAECQRFNYWPGYSSQVQTLTLPSWAFNN